MCMHVCEHISGKRCCLNLCMHLCVHSGHVCEFVWSAFKLSKALYARGGINLQSTIIFVFSVMSMLILDNLFIFSNRDDIRSSLPQLLQQCQRQHRPVQVHMWLAQPCHKCMTASSSTTRRSAAARSVALTSLSSASLRAGPSVKYSSISLPTASGVCHILMLKTSTTKSSLTSWSGRSRTQ